MAEWKTIQEKGIVLHVNAEIRRNKQQNASGKTILEMRRILAIIFVSEAYPAFSLSVPSWKGSFLWLIQFTARKTDDNFIQRATWDKCGIDLFSV